VSARSQRPGTRASRSNTTHSHTYDPCQIYPCRGGALDARAFQPAPTPFPRWRPLIWLARGPCDPTRIVLPTRSSTTTRTPPTLTGALLPACWRPLGSERASPPSSRSSWIRATRVAAEKKAHPSEWAPASGEAPGSVEEKEDGTYPKPGARRGDGHGQRGRRGDGSHMVDGVNPLAHHRVRSGRHPRALGPRVWAIGVPRRWQATYSTLNSMAPPEPRLSSKTASRLA
jgi:hypothetical protein